MKNIIPVITLLVIYCLLVSTSCKKRKLNRQTTTAEDNALAENLFDDVLKNINEVAEEENLDGTGKMGSTDYTFSSSCATITLNPPAWDTNGTWNTTFPKTLTIDFGTVNCTGNDGKNRKGKIVSVFSGKYNVTGTIITTTLQNYHIDDYSVEGTKTITNTGSNSFSIVVDGAVASPDGSQEVTWSSTRTRTWIEGQNTGFWTLNPDSSCCMFFNGILDDVYSISGTAEGTNREGRSFTVNITTPLRVQFCGWLPEITEGVLEIQPEDLKKRTVDFGNKDCDRQYTVTIKNKTYIRNF
ncbi:MAG TPA: hypothetical protein EYM84_05320 [Flavobacteriales bacterium]|nr:hypothetical protein [Flavobacteriales bacterium]